MKHIHLLTTAVLLSSILFSCDKESPAELYITPTDLTFSKEGGCQSVSLTTNKDWTASSSAFWLKVTTSGSSDVALIQVIAEANPELEDRSAAVVIKAGDKSNMINIIQNGDGQIYIPDANFRAYCLANFDENNDGQLSYREAAIPTEMKCRKKNISSLEGIEHFTALEYLDCYDNRLTALDVSKNTALTVLNCSMNIWLTALDVSNNTALTHLSCFANELSALDVSKNTELKILECDQNELTALDVSNNIALTTLNCSVNSLTTLDVSRNTALNNLWISQNQLTALDVSKNTALEDMNCGYNQLTALDVSKNTALTSLTCYNNQLITLDVSNNTELNNLGCYDNPDLVEIWLKSGQSIDYFRKDNHTEIKYKP